MSLLIPAALNAIIKSCKNLNIRKQFCFLFILHLILNCITIAQAETVDLARTKNRLGFQYDDALQTSWTYSEYVDVSLNGGTSITFLFVEWGNDTELTGYPELRIFAANDRIEDVIIMNSATIVIDGNRFEISFDDLHIGDVYGAQVYLTSDALPLMKSLATAQNISTVLRHNGGILSASIPKSEITLIRQFAYDMISIDYLNHIESSYTELESIYKSTTPIVSYVSGEVTVDISKQESYSTVNVGDRITFGRYRQTKDGTDKAPIEWMVLDIQDNKALLLSRYGLEIQQYYPESAVAVTWESCPIREWLNSSFLDAAFTKTEQESIIECLVDNSNKQGYWDVDGGKNTVDKIFLLSYAEANKYIDVVSWEEDYFANKRSRAAVTEYALTSWRKAFHKFSFDTISTSGYETIDGKDAVDWWLRSPGVAQEFASVVSFGGSLWYRVNNHIYASVRPAMWVDLKAIP